MRVTAVSMLIYVYNFSGCVFDSVYHHCNRRCLSTRTAPFFGQIYFRQILRLRTCSVLE